MSEKFWRPQISFNQNLKQWKYIYTPTPTNYYGRHWRVKLLHFTWPRPKITWTRPKSRDLGNTWEWEGGTVHIFIITKQNKVSLIKLVQSVNVRLREGIKQFLGYFCCWFVLSGGRNFICFNYLVSYTKLKENRFYKPALFRLLQMWCSLDFLNQIPQAG